MKLPLCTDCCCGPSVLNSQELGITDIDLENVAVDVFNFKLVITIINAVQRS